MQRDYCLWSNTSVDLGALYAEAERRVSPIVDLETFLDGLPQARPAIAHRHYHRTGTLRAFGIQYTTRQRLEHNLVRSDLGGFDGQIIVVPVGMGEDFSETSEVVRRTTIANNPRILVRVLEITPSDLTVARELRVWQWIQNNCQELRVDEFARSEVKQRLDEFSSNLELRLSSFLVLEDAIIARKGRWFYQSKELDIPDRKALNQKLTEICDETLPRLPHYKKRADQQAPSELFNCQRPHTTYRRDDRASKSRASWLHRDSPGIGHLPYPFPRLPNPPRGQCCKRILPTIR